MSKWKNMLMKSNISSDVNTFGGRVKTAIAMMNRTIAEKNTGCGAKIKFVTVVRAEMREALATEHAKKRVVRFAVVNMLKRRHVGGNSGW